MLECFRSELQKSFFPEGCVLSFSLTIPNLVWFVRIFFLDFCRQLRTAVVRGQPLVKLYEHVEYVFVKFVLKLLPISECTFRIIKLTQDALKELIVINSCKYDVEVATH